MGGERGREGETRNFFPTSTVLVLLGVSGGRRRRRRRKEEEEGRKLARSLAPSDLLVGVVGLRVAPNFINFWSKTGLKLSG